MHTESNANCFRAIFDAVPLSITIADRDGRILEANPACRRMLGYPLEELQKLRVADFVHPHDRPMLLQLVQSIRDRRTDSCQTRSRWIAKDGREIWSLVWLAAMRDESGDVRCWLIILEDVTDRIRAEKAQQTLNQGEARSTARGIAHDLNNLLMAIQGNISLLLLNKDLNHPDVAYLKKMEASVTRASELTRQIQDRARREHPEVKAVDLNQLLEETAETFGSTVSVFLPATGNSVMSDKRQAQAGRPGLKTILLVEDEEMVADIGQQMLERLGYKVLLARTGQDALLLYEKHHRDIDLVILDMIMPGMGGADVFARLKTINPEVAVLLSSGYIVNGQAREILNSGCKGFIQKPFSIEQLSHKIRELFSGKPGHGA